MPHILAKAQQMDISKVHRAQYPAPDRGSSKCWLGVQEWCKHTIRLPPYQLPASCGLILPVPEIVSLCLIALDELSFHEFV